MENLEKVLAEIFEEVKDYVDTVTWVEDHIKGKFDYNIGSTEDQGMYVMDYDEIVYADDDAKKIDWVYAMNTTEIEVLDANGEKRTDQYGNECNWIEIYVGYEIVERNLEEPLETKIKVSSISVN